MRKDTETREAIERIALKNGISISFLTSFYNDWSVYGGSSYYRRDNFELLNLIVAKNPSSFEAVVALQSALKAPLPGKPSKAQKELEYRRALIRIIERA